MALLGDDTFLHCCELLGDSPSFFDCNPHSRTSTRSLAAAPPTSSDLLLPPSVLAPGNYEPEDIREHLEAMVDKECDRSLPEGTPRERKRPRRLSGILTDQTSWGYAVADMNEVREKNGLSAATMALGVAFFRDLLISMGDDEANPHPRGDSLRLLGMCSMILATKMEGADDRQLSMTQWERSAAGGNNGENEGDDDSVVFTSSNLQQVELIMLDSLGWSLHLPTGFDFLAPLLVVAGVEDEQVQRCAGWLIFRSLFGIEFLRSTPSELAIAAILLACEVAGYERALLLEMEARLLQSVQSRDKALVRECQRALRVRCGLLTQEEARERTPDVAEVCYPENFVAPSPLAAECAGESHLHCDWPHGCSIKGGKRCCLAVDGAEEERAGEGNEGVEDEYEGRQHKRARVMDKDRCRGPHLAAVRSAPEELGASTGGEVAMVPAV